MQWKKGCLIAGTHFWSCCLSQGRTTCCFCCRVIICVEGKSEKECKKYHHKFEKLFYYLCFIPWVCGDGKIFVKTVSSSFLICFLYASKHKLTLKLTFFLTHSESITWTISIPVYLFIYMYDDLFWSVSHLQRSVHTLSNTEDHQCNNKSTTLTLQQ